MPDTRDPVQDALHVAVGATLLWVNRMQARRRDLERWLESLADEPRADPEP